MISLCVVSEGKAEDSEEGEILCVFIIRYRFVGMIEGHEPGGLLAGLDDHLLESDSVGSAEATDAVIEFETTPIPREDDDISIQDEGGHGLTFYPERVVWRGQGQDGSRYLENLQGFIFIYLNGGSGGYG